MLSLRFLGYIQDGDNRIGYYALILELGQYVNIPCSRLSQYATNYIFENVQYQDSTNTVIPNDETVQLGIYHGVIDENEIITLVQEPMQVHNLFSARNEYGLTITDTVSDVYPNKRVQYSALCDFIDDPDTSRIGGIVGLRRTGKTVLLKQVFQYCLDKKIPVRMITLSRDTKATMQTLYEVLDILKEQGIKVVLIDEITYIVTFQTQSSLLADYYANLCGMKILISGTYSLGIRLAAKDTLFDRVKPFDTSYISYKEWCRLRPMSVSDYFDHACNLCDNYSDYNEVHDYIDTSIVQNILTSFERSKNARYYKELLPLYNSGDLESVLLRIIDGYAVTMTTRIINSQFKSKMLGSALYLYNKKAKKASLKPLDADVLERIFDDYSYNLQVRSQVHNPVNDEQLGLINRYLGDIGVLNRVLPNSDLFRTHEKVVQYGLVAQCCTHLSQAILATLINGYSREAQFLAHLVLTDVKGNLLETLIQYETARYVEKQYITKYRTASREIDMIVYDSAIHACRLYEIKWSSVCDETQSQWLRNETVLTDIRSMYGDIQSRNVIYNGATRDMTYGTDNIHYINAEEYLKSL